MPKDYFVSSDDDCVEDSQQPNVPTRSTPQKKQKKPQRYAQPQVDDTEEMLFDHKYPDAEHETQNQALNDELPAAPDQDDVIKILVATDIHCGYGENKSIINMDAVNTFEEVLQIATKQKVDMVLLGGDLFHENNPSREVQHRVTQLLRQYCMNENPIALEFLSDASVNFNQSVFGHVNYYDKNLNIGLPIFTIHGNHDDLSGKGLTALDLLHESGLVNLFGKHGSIQEFTISPILLRKGKTLLALYGLGSQRDDRLVRAFKNQNITFYRPSAGAEDWFNLFVLHQNRPRRAMHRSTGNYLPEALIPSFFDLLVWGHEHECKPDPQFVASSEVVGDGFYILQPGSTVATSLTHEEALQKNVFVVKIKGRKFASKPIPLQTVRPMIVDEMVLSRIPSGCKPASKTDRPKNREGNYVDEVAIEEKLNEMIEKAKEIRKPTQPELPLIRLKVTYDGDWIDITPANAKRIGLRYEDTVANALDMVVIKKNVAPKDSKKKQRNTGEDNLLDDLGNISTANLQSMITDYFDAQPLDSRMTVLKPDGIGKALEQYSELEEGGSAASANKGFDASLMYQIDTIRSALKMMPLPEIETAADLRRFKDFIIKDLTDMKRAEYEQIGKVKTASFSRGQQDWYDEQEYMLPVGGSTKKPVDEEEKEEEEEDEVVMDSFSDDEEPGTSYKVMKPTRGATRGRGSRGGSARGTQKTQETRPSAQPMVPVRGVRSNRGSRGKAKPSTSRGRISSDSDIEEIDDLRRPNDSPSPPPPKRNTRGGKPTSAGKKKDLFSYF